MLESHTDSFQLYAGQLPVIGRRGQRRLADATVLVIGAGRIGTNVVLGLHAAGVGTIEVIDPQTVEPEQLGPTWFATKADVGRPKAEVLGRFLSRRSAGNVRGHHVPVESPIAESFFAKCDLAISCANTVPARLTAERLAIRSSVAVIQAAAFDGRNRLGGLIHLHVPQAPSASCFGCFLELDWGMAPRGEGLLPSVTAMIGHLAAHLGILTLIGPNEQQSEANLFILDLEGGAMEPLRVERRSGCPICG